MGNTASSTAAEPEFLPSLYGSLFSAALPVHVKGAFQHKGKSEDADSIIIAARKYIELYNAQTGDRRVKVNSGVPITCVDYAPTTSLGYPIVVTGTQSGEVVVYHAESLEVAKRFRPCKGVIYVTSISCPNPNLLIVGDSNGSAQSIRLDRYQLVRTYSPPQEVSDALRNASSGGVAYQRELQVVSIAIFGPRNKPVLALGWLQGVILTYGLHDGIYLSRFSVEPKLNRVISLPQFRALLCARQNDNAIYIRDWAAGKHVTLDPAEELQTLSRAHTKTTSITYDDRRSILFCGCSDGAILLRKLQRNKKTKEISMRLLKVCRPKSSTGSPMSAIHLWYNSPTDTLIAGDNVGQARCIRNITGVHEEEAMFQDEEYEEELEIALDEDEDGEEQAVDQQSSNIKKQWALRCTGGHVLIDSTGGIARYYFEENALPTGVRHNNGTSQYGQTTAAYLSPFCDRVESAGIDGECQPLPFGYERQPTRTNAEWNTCQFVDKSPASSDFEFIKSSSWEYTNVKGFVEEIEVESGNVQKLGDDEVSERAELTVYTRNPSGLTGLVARKTFTVEGTKVNVDCSIESEKERSVPLGLVFPFNLPEDVDLELAEPDFEVGYTSPTNPISIELGTNTRTATLPLGVQFTSLDNIPMHDAGDSFNLKEYLLLAIDAVMIQLCGVEDGSVLIKHKGNNCAYRLSWDNEILDSLLIKTTANPNSTRTMLLSPCRAAFDYGPLVSNSSNPLQDRSVQTTYNFNASEKVEFSYSFEVVPLDSKTSEEPTTASASTGGKGKRKKKGKKKNLAVTTLVDRIKIP
eukprot:gb/GECG01002216.1/.p1 GENE.gb/GECG01002216.1/~~gb/GECG01002216.1/.p1  ORF type:complete len:805 (+),score=98.62 gb/GECG01002216.1/:1-2415(+)